MVRWKARDGLHQVYQWLDEGRDASAWIDLEINVKEALSIEEIHRLRQSHPGFIHIRPIFEESRGQESVRQANLPINEIFRRFYERQTGGAQPSEELIHLFLELIQQDPSEQKTEVKP